MAKYTFFVFAILFTSIISSQTGPGGVGSSTNNGLWLKADSFTSFGAVSSWTDSSGNGNNAAQANTDKQPISIATSALNNMPIVRFDGLNNTLGDEMAVPDADILDNSTGISIFTVLRPNNLDNSPRGILGKRIAFTNSSNYSYTWFMHTGQRLNLDIERQNDRFNTGSTTFSNANNYILSFTFDGTLASSQRSKIYNGMTLAATGSESSTSIGNGTADFAIGALNVGYNTYLGADYAEIIQYNFTVNEAQRIIINNYLSAKYNVALSSNDFYTQDDSGNFDFDVAGIGQATDGSNHIDSQGSGIIRINTPSSLNNDDFLFWGRNNQTSYSFSTNTSNYKERITSNWRVSKRNDLGNVTVEIDMTGIDLSGKQSCAPLQLIVDNDADLLSPTTTYTLTNTSGNIYQATGVSFSDGDYFTIEYIDTIVLDGTQFYNGSGTANRPNTSDDCYKLLVKNTATGTLSLSENANVREIEVESGGKLVVDTEKGLQVTNGITLNGEIRLLDKAQLIQTHTGTSTITGTGNLYIDRDSEVVSKFLYNYFSSPVVANGSNNYTVASVMKDGTTPTSISSSPPDINYITGLDGNFSGSPIEIADRWIYTYDDIGGGTYAYDNNSNAGSTQTIEPGKGFLFKGPGRTQNYTFVGTPNDGTYTYASIPSGVNILVGNPYPSAFDVQEFLSDNSALGSTIYLWQQAAVDNTSEGHFSSGYNGDYAIINSSTSTSGTLPSEITLTEEAEDASLGGSATINGDKVRFNYCFR